MKARFKVKSTLLFDFVKSNTLLLTLKAYRDKIKLTKGVLLWLKKFI